MARQFTNDNNYPHWLYHTLTTNNYTKGTKPSDISVTRLIDSPQINALRYKHADELVEDVDRPRRFCSRTISTDGHSF